MQFTYYNTNHLSAHESFFAQKLTSFTHRVVKEASSVASLEFADELISSLDKLSPYLQSFKHMILLGVGGSALGTRALQESFCPKGPRALSSRGERSLWIVDNTDMPLFQECLENLSPQETIVLVISKSGSTLSTIAQYHICKKWLQEALPENIAENSQKDCTIHSSINTDFNAKNTSWHEHIFVVTDPCSGFLREEVNKYSFASLPVPQDMSGRFSLFSAVGMVSSAFLGIDYTQFLKGAQSARDTFFAQSATFIKKFHEDKEIQAQNPLPPLFKMAYFAFESMEQDFSQLIFFSYIPKWERLGDWFRQLWSESLGKAGHGSTPIPALGATDQHSILQLFLDGKKDKACLFLTEDFQEKVTSSIISSHNFVPQEISQEWKWIAGKSLAQILNTEAIATRTTLVNAGMPLINITVDNTSEYAFGKMTWDLCMLTIMTAYFLDLNPFDQPAVEQGKKMTKASLSQS